MLLDVDGGAPILERGRGDAAILASDLDLGLDGGRLRYRASYSLEAGDVFSFTEPGYAGVELPSSVAGQTFGQNVVLELPGLAGAPMSLGMSAEIREQWLVAGAGRSERERATLEWSPGPATVNLDWTGSATAFDPTLALRCSVAGTLHLPTGEADGRSQTLRFSGRDCIVAEGSPYAGTPARTWGVGYVWSGGAQASEARLRVIDPVWSGEMAGFETDPGYQVGLSHRRNLGALSAQALVAVQQAPALQQGRVDEIRIDDPAWSATASLTWDLEKASVSANWASGVDPLWFAPAPSERRDRFGFALDASALFESLALRSSPELGLRWDWSQVRLPGGAADAESSLRLDVALMF